MQWHKFKILIFITLFLTTCCTLSSCGGRKAKACPAFSEAQNTGGSIDKNKKRKRKKTKQGVFDKKTNRKYRKHRKK
ncbi:MAG: hypothetical protein ACI9UJ_001675 [bacterium]|jgi:hypothetical protein